MRYLSVCSGIEAATVAWHVLGWSPTAFSEIEAFPSAVLAHHYPNVPNLGDMTKFEAWDRDILSDSDILVGGTPCQAFSVAGLRAGLSDERGQLTITYIKLLNHIDAIRREDGKQPTIAVWENVPGVLSSKDNAFGAFLGGLAGEDCELVPSGKRWPDAGCVYGPQRAIAWRVLDAQYFGLAQRRRRVFVVASAGNLDPSEILFEFDGVRRDTPPSREAGERVAGNAGTCAESGCGVKGSHWDAPLNAHPILNQSHNTGGIGASNQEIFSQGGSGLVPAQKWPAEIASTLNAAFGSKLGLENQHINGGAPLFVPAVAIQGSMIGREDHNDPQGDGINEDVCFTLNCTDRHAAAFHPTQDPISSTNGTTHALGCGSSSGQASVAVAFGTDCYNGNVTGDICGTLGTNGASSTSSSFPTVSTQMQVRRLTPTECERLQGFPDGYTQIRGKRNLRKIAPTARVIKLLETAWRRM